MEKTRQEWLKQTFFRGEALTLEDPLYLRWVQIFTEGLLEADLGQGDLTVQALMSGREQGRAEMVANEAGILAGLDELVWFYRRHGLALERLKADGDLVHPGEAVLRAEGDLKTLLALERTGLNLLQRMSGIATLTRRLQERIRHRSPTTFVVATRKTPWGLLDKRAVHLGGGGTHRLGLWDTILIKNNHLKALASSEEEAVPLAVKRAWSHRGQAVFIEVEVTGLPGALAAARTFRELQNGQAPFPCVMMLDNVTPEDAERIILALRDQGLYDHVLIEASGRIAGESIEAYAAAGVDAISVGALTHSAKALDLHQVLE
ncbi:MAG: carboxylating nicotinate-nucleotide diphosphorylase [candidate division NC10 bacterium]|nr:carboxylating nicotinate-nucleotide diphosphorylase [candidate division NC10 bacterium]